MPELPEVETIKRGLENSLKNQTIHDIKLHRQNLRHPMPTLLETGFVNARILNLTRRGKYILMHLDTQSTILFHLGMSGKIIVKPYDTQYQHQKHEHFTLITKEGQILSYIDPRRFGIIDLFESDTLHPMLCDMGPEPLLEHEDVVYQQSLVTHLYTKLKDKKQPIKNTLLDQHIIAGLGNIYVCEALFMAGISPLRLSCIITKKECLKIIQSVQSILLQAIQAGGSSMRDYVHSNGKKGYFQIQWQAYGKGGILSQRCSIKGKKAFIKRVVQAGRSSFYCETCQH